MVDRYNCSRKICVITNLSCNLNCIYCYQNKNGNEFDVNSTIDRLSKSLERKTTLGTIIKFLGGESFLVFPKIKQICESLWERSYEEKFLFHATSNGTLIHGEIKEWLYRNRNRFTVKLSLDGNKEAQDINRPGSFEKIDFDFFASSWPKVGVKMTISPQTLHLLADSIIYLHSKGFITIKPNFADLTNWEYPGLYTQYYNQLLKLSEYYLSNPQIEPCKLFKVPFRRTLNSATQYCQCTFGTRNVIDYNTGKTYPCLFFMPSVCGEEKSLELEKLNFTNPQSLLSGECKGCPFLNICVTCYAANYIERGAIEKRNLHICKFQKIQFLVNANFMIKKYVYDHHDISSDVHRNEVYSDIKAIQYLLPELNKIEDNLSNY